MFTTINDNNDTKKIIDMSEARINILSIIVQTYIFSFFCLRSLNLIRYKYYVLIIIWLRFIILHFLNDNDEI